MTALATSDYRSTGTKHVGGFRRAWPFKADAVERIAAIIDREFQVEGVGTVINGFCGASAPLTYHEVRVDLHHPSATLRVDMADLDKHVQNAAIIVMDPAYAEPVQVRQRILSAAMRALRPGGLLVVHAPWWPRFKGAELQTGAVFGPFFREDVSIGWPHPPVILSCWRKVGLCSRCATGIHGRGCSCLCPRCNAAQTDQDGGA